MRRGAHFRADPPFFFFSLLLPEKMIQYIIMRKAFTPILLLAVIIVPLSSYAAPCYGTRMPSRHEFFSGVEEYMFFERELEKDEGKVRSSQSFYLISYGIFDWLSLDLKIGVGDIRRYDAPADNIDYSDRFAGGYGFRIRLYEKERLKLVTGFQHISVHPETVKLDNRKYKAVLDDWQVSLLGSYSLTFATPYVGTRLSRTDYINWIDNNRKRTMSDTGKCAGLITGIDIPVADKMWVNAEASFFDAEALAISLNARF